MINLDSLLELLAIPKENINLFSLRQSNRAKRLIFKPSIRNGFEIVIPRLDCTRTLHRIGGHCRTTKEDAPSIRTE